MIEIKVAQGNIVEQESDCIVVNLFDGVAEPSGATGAVDKALDGAITSLVRGGDFTGKAGTSALLYTNGKLPADRVLIVGLGAAEDFDLHAVRKVAATAASAVAKLPGVESYASIVHGGGAAGLDTVAAAQAMIEGTLLALYVAPQYRRETEPEKPSTFTLLEYDEDKIDAVRAGADAGLAIAYGVYSARNYASEPPNVLYPKTFALRAEKMAETVGLRYSVLKRRDMRELGMGLALAVSQGSARGPRMIILEHAPTGTEGQPPLVFVGKGITFDTGGISIKPSQDMWYMKDDMSGAAAVIGAMEAIARRGLQRHVIGVAICVENMPDGKAYRPADIVTGITGKTAEIISTDAEGRLVLADALGYVARFAPAGVVDLATLTGSIGVALGPQAAGVFSNDAHLEDALLDAAGRSGERLWPMPMYEEYEEDIKSEMAEVKNAGGRTSGVATSAKFIEHFTEGYPWAHLDIASMSWRDDDSAPLIPKGATGYGVRLLVELASAFPAQTKQ